MTALDRLNRLAAAAAEAELRACCGSRAWARGMAAARPFASTAALLARADELWWSLGEADWLEAFRSHPPIGGRKAEAGQTARERAWSAGEQAAAVAADEETQSALAEANRAYQARFGFIFIVCATGRSAGEMLEMLRLRLGNEAADELRVAAAEQAKITAIRLEKLLAG